ncbi:MAG: hypothetical protein AVDCRST_MAG79-1174, partial [uncultured Thermoleophilia bacterium]
ARPRQLRLGRGDLGGPRAARRAVPARDRRPARLRGQSSGRSGGLRPRRRRPRAAAGGRSPPGRALLRRDRLPARGGRPAGGRALAHGHRAAALRPDAGRARREGADRGAARALGPGRGAVARGVPGGVPAGARPLRHRRPAPEAPRRRGRARLHGGAAPRRGRAADGGARPGAVPAARRLGRLGRAPRGRPRTWPCRVRGRLRRPGGHHGRRAGGRPRRRAQPATPRRALQRAAGAVPDHGHGPAADRSGHRV